MAIARRWLAICGVGALAWGLLLVLLAYLQPDIESTPARPNALALHPGFATIQSPWMVVIGLPALAVIAGALWGSVRLGIPSLVTVWMGTAVLCMEALLTLPSLGMGLLPLAAFGFAAGVIQATYLPGAAARA